MTVFLLWLSLHYKAVCACGVRRSIIRAAIYFLILFQLSGCSSWHDWHMKRSLEKMRSEARKKIDVDACLALGGKVEGIGMFGIPSCVVYYTDGGKTCADNSECEGDCFTPNIFEIGTPMQGVCQSSEHDAFGCVSTIENSVVREAICQD